MWPTSFVDETKGVRWHGVVRHKPQILDARRKVQEIADFLAMQRLLDFAEFNLRRRLVYHRGKRFTRRRLPCISNGDANRVVDRAHGGVG